MIKSLERSSWCTDVLFHRHSCGLTCFVFVIFPTTFSYERNLQFSDEKVSHSSQNVVQPIAVESLSLMHESARQFVDDFSRKISGRSGNGDEGSFLFQRISVCCTVSVQFCCTSVSFQLTARIGGRSTPLAIAYF